LFRHANLGVAWRLEMLSLQISERAREFAVADFVARAEQFHERGQERRPQLFSTARAHIGGSIDRVTGDVEATSVVRATNPPRTVTSMDYSLKCRPAQRMF
jgi:hypothetical protein